MNLNRLKQFRPLAFSFQPFFELSANAFGSDWAQLPTLTQPSTFNYQPTRAPLNKERRFLPLRLDDALIKGSLAQFLYIN